MKAQTLIGIVLIVIGLVGLAYGGISFTREETVLDLGPLQVTGEERETIPLPPLLGALAFVGGIVLLVAGARTRS